MKETNRFITYGRKKGLDYNEFETVRETMERWSTKLSSLQSEFQVVQNAFEKAMYSGQTMTQEEVEQATAMIKVIRERIGERQDQSKKQGRRFTCSSRYCFTRSVSRSFLYRRELCNKFLLYGIVCVIVKVRE